LVLPHPIELNVVGWKQWHFIAVMPQPTANTGLSINMKQKNPISETDDRFQF
jgi:hypothetical protein